MHDNEYVYEGDTEFHEYEANVDIRKCSSRNCNIEKDKWELEEVYDAQGIYVGRFCSYECAEKNSGIMLHRTNQEAYEAGDW